jgi:hypothetical protein
MESLISSEDREAQEIIKKILEINEEKTRFNRHWVSRCKPFIDSLSQFK